MADRTDTTVIFHSCPPHRVRTVLMVLEDYGLAWIVEPGRCQTLELADGFRDELPVGIVPKLAAALVKAAPEAAFTAYAGPRHEWAGQMHSYVPGLGMFAAECDAAGEAVFRQSMVAQWANESADERQKLLGLPWIKAIDFMPPGAVTEPEFYVKYSYYRTWDHVVMGPFNGATKPRIVLHTKDDWNVSRRGFVYSAAHRGGTDLDEQSKAELVANNPSWQWKAHGRITKTVLYLPAST